MTTTTAGIPAQRIEGCVGTAAITGQRARA
jgi:hypothetical protein